MFDMIRMAAEEYLRPHIDRLKARAVLAVVSIALMILFGIMAFISVIAIVFIGISNSTSPIEAASIMFGFCLLMLLGTFAVYRIALGIEARRFDVRMPLPRRPQERLGSSRMDERIDDIKDQVRDTIARNKFGGLAAIAVAGVLIGSRPRWALGLARFAIGRTLKQRVRDRNRD